MSRKNKIRVIACILAILFIISAFWNELAVRNYTVKSAETGSNETIRVVLITDLHSYIYGEHQSRIVSLIKRQKPDIIALAGDIADDVAPIEGTKQFLAGIKGLAPVYYVTGNHEFWSGDIKNIRNTIREYGATILENSFEKLRIRGTDLIIGGVDDPDISRYEKPGFDWLGALNKAFAKLDEESGFKILLAHRPELIDIYKKYDFDLVVSGHAHGGQVRIPFVLNGLLAPNQGWFPKYAGGQYKHGTLTHIVSRGVSYNPRLPRIFNPPEVVVIDIK